MNIDQASKYKILKNIKDKIDEIIEKILGVNDYTYPNINDEYDEIRGITVWQRIEHFSLLLSFFLNFIFIFLFIYLNYNDMTLLCIII